MTSIMIEFKNNTEKIWHKNDIYFSLIQNCKNYVQKWYLLWSNPKRIPEGFGLVWWHINLCGLFNAKVILVEEQQWYYLNHSWGG